MPTVEELEQEFIDLDLGDVDDGTDPLPAAVTLMKVKSITPKHKEGSDYPYLSVVLNPIGVPGKEKRSIWMNLSKNPSALWNMKAFAKACKCYGSDGKIDLKGMVGREVFVTLKINEQNRNEVTTPYSPAS